MTPEVDSGARKYLALMEVSRVIACHRDLGDLFDRLADLLHQVLGVHSLSVALHDDHRDVMRLHVLRSSVKQTDTVGVEFSVHDSPSGAVWRTQKLLNFQCFDGLSRYPTASELLREHGVQSFCSLPLTTAPRRV